MTENKRYFSIDYDEEYYIFDSTKISKEEVLEKAEYSYDVFGDSLNSDEICDLLNEQEETIQRLKAQLEHGEDVCRICKPTYLVPSREYYIAQCKKGYSGCSKGTVDYCDDFELKDSDSK